MIRVGFVSDKENAVSLCKAQPDSPYAAGIALAGFGTQPMPGAVCDDAIQQAVNFTAHYIQKALDVLQEKECSDMIQARQFLARQLEKLNGSIAYFGKSVGQGIYLAGTVCYVAGDQFTCLSFGGGCAYLWDGKAVTPLTTDPNPDPKYIRNAIGGTNTWSGIAAEGTLGGGHQLLCMTQQPPEELLPAIMATLIHTNPGYVVTSVYSGMGATDIPIAVLDIMQAAKAPAKEVPST